MLFDLSSPGRKNVVRVVYGILAVLFVVGFVGFGIGGELGGGGILDGLTGDNNSTSDAFEQQIEDAEEAVEKDPQDEKALTELILLRAQSGSSQLEVDEATGQPTALTEESRSEYEEVVSIWQDYLDTKPKEVDLAAGNAAVLAYRYLGDIDGAVEAQELIARSDPSGSSYGALASFLYADLQIDEGDKARDKALAESNGQTDKLIERQLNTIRKQAVKFKKQQAKAPTSGEGSTPELSDPFGNLSPTAPGAPPDPGALPPP